MRIALEGEYATILAPVTPQLVDTIVELYHESVATLMRHSWAQQACLESENWRAYDILESKIAAARKAYGLNKQNYSTLLEIYAHQRST